MDDCIPAKRTNARGYGVVYLDGREQRAHRVAWVQAHGPIPKGQEVRHRCDNPPCVNVGHLELGTHAQNMRDAVERNRIAHGARNARTRLSDEDVRKIRERSAGGTSYAALGREFGVHRVTIMRICTGDARVRVE